MDLDAQLGAVQAPKQYCPQQRQTPRKVIFQGLPRFGVAKKASRDMLIPLLRPGVRRGSLLEAVGVFEGVAGVGFIFFADR
jgi:hypothetical protein